MHVAQYSTRTVNHIENRWIFLFLFFKQQILFNHQVSPQDEHRSIKLRIQIKDAVYMQNTRK